MQELDTHIVVKYEELSIYVFGGTYLLGSLPQSVYQQFNATIALGLNFI